jgi:hypothetical protein
VAGCINAICALPIMLSFASIIFRDPFFKPYLGNLVKLVFLVGAVLWAAVRCRAALRCAVRWHAALSCTALLLSKTTACTKKPLTPRPASPAWLRTHPPTHPRPAPSSPLQSSALHQAAFAALSSMPFAVGQVQDVGLIFLSAIASAVVDQCSAAGLSGADTLSTALASLTTATFIVGVLIIGTGEPRCQRPCAGGLQQAHHISLLVTCTCCSAPLPRWHSLPRMHHSTLIWCTALPCPALPCPACSTSQEPCGWPAWCSTCRCLSLAATLRSWDTFAWQQVGG